MRVPSYTEYGDLVVESLKKLSYTELKSWVERRLRGTDSAAGTAPEEFPHYMLVESYPKLPPALREDIQRLLIEFIRDFARNEGSIWRAAPGDDLFLLFDPILIASSWKEEAVDELRILVENKVTAVELIGSANHRRALQGLLTLGYKGTIRFWLDQAKTGSSVVLPVVFEGLSQLDPHAALEWLGGRERSTSGRILFSYLPFLIENNGFAALRPALRRLLDELPREDSDAIRDYLSYEGFSLEQDVAVGQEAGRSRGLAVTKDSDLSERTRRLAGGVAGDLSNQVTAILGYAELLHSNKSLKGSLRDDLQRIRRAAQSAVWLSKRFLSYGREPAHHRSVFDLNDIVRSAEDFRRLYRLNIDLVTKTDSHPVWVKADPEQLRQVLLNLLMNAGKAMPSGGRVTVEAGRVDPRKLSRRQTVPVVGPSARLSVSDTGAGIDAEKLGQIFDPFYTTRPPEGGTGLGLAVVQAIVRQSHGHVEVSSRPGLGTTVTIYLPRANRTLATAARRRKETGSITVLVVEDEEPIRTLASRVLRGAGYHVLEAASGEEALELAGRADTRFQGVLTDLRMPRMSGLELVERLRAIKPDARVLYTSASAAAPESLGLTGLQILEKPFTPQDLALRVDEVLGAISDE